MTSTSGRTRGPYARTAERRRVIAQAVLDLVREKGHAAVTTAEIADRSDTPEPTVLYHYPTKDHLLVAALQRADDEDDERHPAADGAAAATLDGLRAYTRTNPERVHVMRLYAALAGDATVPGHPAQDFFAARYQRVVAEFARLVRQRQDAGLAHPGLDPAEVGRHLVAVWDGLQSQWLVSQDFDLPDALLSAFRRLTGQNWMEAGQTSLNPHAGI